MEFLGWRTVPTRPDVLGKKAVDCMPYIMQAFVKKPEDVEKGLPFDRKLYVARRVFEQTCEDTYVVSLSSRTIVYKGMFLVGQLRTFFEDLQDKDYESAIAIVHSRFSAPIRTRAGRERIPTVSSCTTERSIRSKATRTACWPGRRPCTLLILEEEMSQDRYRWSTRQVPIPPCWTIRWSFS